jgi:hypothetical protein
LLLLSSDTARTKIYELSRKEQNTFHIHHCDIIVRNDETHIPSTYTKKKRRKKNQIKKSQTKKKKYTKTYFPQTVPQDTLSVSSEQRTLGTNFFPQAHNLVAKKGHGGQETVSS